MKLSEERSMPDQTTVAVAGLLALFIWLLPDPILGANADQCWTAYYVDGSVAGCWADIWMKS